jgi:peptide methionine sulfoxide reductase msrA/msrB
MQTRTIWVAAAVTVGVGAAGFVLARQLSAPSQAVAQPPAAAPPPETSATMGPPGKHRDLTPEEERVIVHKGTERPFTGKYHDFFGEGVYACRRCGALLYRSEHKFRSECGWPAFDDELPGAVRRLPDADGVRTEIVCANCEGHLGHVFTGERLTARNVRHCVNSISLQFIPADQVKYGRALFAAGCFWGVEYRFQRQPGVLGTTVGYTGGTTPNPTYETLHSQGTGHAEAVEVIYDPARVTYEELVKLFFEIHDPTQHDGQGPDLGREYRSAIFTIDGEQQQVAERLVAELEARGMDIATQVVPAGTFWPAEGYHQDWYAKKGSGPAACHRRRQLW